MSAYHETDSGHIEVPGPVIIDIYRGEDGVYRDENGFVIDGNDSRWKCEPIVVNVPAPIVAKVLTDVLRTAPAAFWGPETDQDRWMADAPSDVPSDEVWAVLDRLYGDEDVPDQIDLGTVSDLDWWFETSFPDA